MIRVTLHIYAYWNIFTPYSSAHERRSSIFKRIVTEAAKILPMIPIISERIDQNISRVENLVLIYENLDLRADDGRRRRHDTDILRAAVVMLHASLEDFLRGVLQWRLPVSGKNEIDLVPLLGQGKRNAEKFNLGSLVEYRDWKVSDLIDDSVKSYLDNWSTFNDAAQVKNAIDRSGLESEGFNYTEISEMISRRHNIVHKADAVFTDGLDIAHQVTPITITRVRTYTKTVKELKGFILQQLKPIEFCPQTSFSLYAKAVDFLIIQKRIMIEDLVNYLKVTGRSYFLARDMVAIGHARIGPGKNEVEATISTLDEADELLRRFCRNHVVVKEISRTSEFNAGFSKDEFISLVTKLCGLEDSSMSVIQNGSKALLRYIWGAGYISSSGDVLKLLDKPADGPHTIAKGASFKGRQMNMFFGEATFPNVVSALEQLKENFIEDVTIAERFNKNMETALFKFSLVNVDGSLAIPNSRRKWSAEKLVRHAALENSVVKFVVETIEKEPISSGAELGKKVAQQFNRNWSSGSLQRNGSALGRWAAWLMSTDSHRRTPSEIQDSQSVAQELRNLSSDQFGSLELVQKYGDRLNLGGHGRPPSVPEPLVAVANILRNDDKMTYIEIANRMGVSRPSLYRAIKRYKDKNKK